LQVDDVAEFPTATPSFNFSLDERLALNGGPEKVEGLAAGFLAEYERGQLWPVPLARTGMQGECIGRVSPYPIPGRCGGANPPVGGVRGVEGAANIVYRPRYPDETRLSGLSR
jgi:hypothetical protein